jgi:adenosylmethionine-8-amino-7-oxononanoate aminotransferase
MNNCQSETLLDIDRNHIWHPYASMTERPLIHAVQSAHGVRLTLSDGRELIDGMASWWSAIHGYNNPVLNQAVKEQLDKMSHVMFGGLTHEPACLLAEKLVRITPAPLQHVFFSDSGSVAVEVAIKMAIQYWGARQQPEKHRLLSLRCGYHGDTFAAMSVCDPVTGMHSLFSKVLPKQLFADAPQCRFDQAWDENDIASMKQLLADNHASIAAVILEPIVQGAGGMRFYSPTYLKRARELCDQFDVLLIADEIATGFGRTGKLFACEHAGISPDIMCVGKALTGGYMTLAATLTTAHVSEKICAGKPGIFMHGPTFMGNPLACSASLASINLLEEVGESGLSWQDNITRIESTLKQRLSPAKDIEHVRDVRVLGAIGVIETQTPVRMDEITSAFVEKGIWVRPFGKLVYIMPPYIIPDQDLVYLADKLVEVVSNKALFSE